jgi:hypothetical protein
LSTSAISPKNDPCFSVKSGDLLSLASTVHLPR